MNTIDLETIRIRSKLLAMGVPELVIDNIVDEFEIVLSCGMTAKAKLNELLLKGITEETKAGVNSVFIEMATATLEDKMDNMKTGIMTVNGLDRDIPYNYAYSYSASDETDYEFICLSNIDCNTCGVFVSALLSHFHNTGTDVGNEVINLEGDGETIPTKVQEVVINEDLLTHCLIMMESNKVVKPKRMFQVILSDNEGFFPGDESYDTDLYQPILPKIAAVH